MRFAMLVPGGAMPFRYGSYVIVAMIGATIVAFWSRYFSALTSAPSSDHFHGITATLWMLFLALQSWSIHSGRRATHRTIGISSLLLFPLFLAGNVAVVLNMAQTTPTDIFYQYQLHGARLGIMDAASPFILGWLYYHALSERRNVQLHARYLMAMPLFLIMPIASRIISDFVPGLQMHGPEDFHLFPWGIRLANIISLICAAWLYSTAPRHGRPFLVAGGALLFQSVGFDTLALTEGWQTMFLAIGNLPVWPTLLAATIAGAALSWFGWVNGASPKRKAKTLVDSVT